MSLTDRLAAWLQAGGRRIGQVLIEPLNGGGFALRHEDDRESEGAALEKAQGPVGAREIALYDDGGEYRPLKSAPSLRRGWRLELADLGELREALDYFYPAAFGTWIAFADGRCEAVPVRVTLGRQTGMYKFANGLSDDGMQKLVAETCGSGSCLRRPCWEIEPGKGIQSLPPEDLGGEVHDVGELPILCTEVCNWFVAKARKASKAEFDAAGGD